MEHRTLVVAEDNRVIADMLTVLLGSLGYTVVACHEGAAVSACVAESQPHLVILDIQLPGLDGIEVFQQLRAGHGAIPVIFFTASEDLLHARLPDYRSQRAALVSKPNVVQLPPLIQQMLARD